MLSNLKCTRQCLKVTSQSVSLHRRCSNSAHHTPHHKKTHYEVLKVPKTATSDQIRTAYIKRCKELHPDRNIGDPQNHNKMVRLNEAYQCLSKKSSKADYDRKLNMGINITESYYPSSQQRPYEPPRPDSSSYQQWQQTYYGASREERAYAERVYWQQQQKQEKTNEGVRFSNSLILPFIFGLSAFFSGAILQHNKDRQIRPKRAERSMAQRELNRSKGIYFNEGNYPRPYRRNGRQSQSSDMEEKEIGS